MHLGWVDLITANTQLYAAEFQSIWNARELAGRKSRALSPTGAALPIQPADVQEKVDGGLPQAARRCGKIFNMLRVGEAYL